MRVNFDDDLVAGNGVFKTTEKSKAVTYGYGRREGGKEGGKLRVMTGSGSNDNKKYKSLKDK